MPSANCNDIKKNQRSWITVKFSGTRSYDRYRYVEEAIDNVKDNGSVDGMTEKDEIKDKEKNMREEKKIESVRDVEGMDMILNNEDDDFTTLGEVSSSTK